LKKREFFTPAALTRILARVINDDRFGFVTWHAFYRMVSREYFSRFREEINELSKSSLAGRVDRDEFYNKARELVELIQRISQLLPYGNYIVELAAIVFEIADALSRIR